LNKFQKIESLPIATEIENKIIASICRDGSNIFKISEFVTQFDFYYEHNRDLFKLVCDLTDKLPVVDFEIIFSALLQKGNTELLKRLPELQRYYSHSLEFDCLILKEYSLRRKLIQHHKKSLATALDTTNDILELVSNDYNAIENISSEIQAVNSNAETLEIICKDISTKLYENKLYKKQFLTQYEALNNATGGFLDGDYICVGGRTSMGKSALAHSITHYGLQQNKRIVFFSFEMTNLQNIFRQVSIATSIPIYRLRRLEKLTDSDKIKFDSYLTEMQKMKLHFINSSGKNILDLVMRAKSLHSNYDLDLIIIDYIQRIHGAKNYNNQHAELTDVSNRIKDLAANLGLPVLVFSQLNRQFETRTANEKLPTLSDLRGSGTIEEDSDIVLFVHRPAKLLSDTERFNKYSNGIEDDCSFIIAKNRSGDTGDIKVSFDERRAYFLEPSNNRLNFDDDKPKF